MGIKRKASFTTVTSPNAKSSYHVASSPVPLFPGDVMTIDETPRHLHSRTRKRFKNDRPDEQSLYDKTIRWLFSAQKQPKSCDIPMTPPPTEPVTDEQSQPSSILDPMQRTLRTFFQPSHLTPRRTPSSSRNDSPGSDLSFHNGPVSLDSGESTSSTSLDVDMGMSMDLDLPPSANQPKKWVGGIGWM